MSEPIDEENPVAYYKRVAEELERIANTVIQHPEIDRDLSARLYAFAEQIRRDSAIICVPEGCAIN